VLWHWALNEHARPFARAPGIARQAVGVLVVSKKSLQEMAATAFVQAAKNAGVAEVSADASLTGPGVASGELSTVALDEPPHADMSSATEPPMVANAKRTRKDLRMAPTIAKQSPRAAPGTDPRNPTKNRDLGVGRGGPRDVH
jgi:hypothetical protein